MTLPAAFVRTASRRDLSAIRDLLVETWHATYDSIYGAAKVKEINDEWHATAALEKRLSMPHSEFVVADDGKILLGMAFASQREKRVTLHQLYVSPSAQGRNIGTDLLQEIIFCFDGANEISLEVDPANTGAIRFYEAFGFEKSGETANCGAEGSGIPAAVYSMKI